MSKFRRRLMALSTLRPHIKDEFVRVEYIENTSNAYIDTKLFTVYNDGRTYKHIVNLSYTVTNEKQLNGANGSGYFGIDKNGKFECAYIQDSAIAAGDSWHNINFSYYNPTNTSLNVKYEIDNQLLEKNISKATLYNYPYAIFIFAIGGRNDAAPSFFCKERIKSYQIYIDDVLVRNFIPVLNKATDEYGMYDLVEKKFYVSPNGTKFVGGREIIYDAEIEYLETQGNCNIPTPYVPSGLNIGIQTKFMPLGYTQNTNWISWYVAYTNEQTQCFRCMRPRSNDLIWITNGAVSAGSGSDPAYNITFGNTYEIVTKGRSISVNGVTKTGRTQSSTQNTGILFIFSNTFKGRCYYFKVLDNGNLILDCIPVRIGNVGYMYDKVSNKLFGNNGSGSFILGQDTVVYDKI